MPGSPSSPLGQAVRYFINHHEALGRFIECSTPLYTLLGCCALAEVDPEAYLADVLPRLARGGVTLEQARALLPHRWRSRRRAG